ncbi:MAG: PAS domain S-box protein [Proteobacteria bacterium]|nr:PAS domain S-box protein [Pseudomonadota bacterium]
MNSAEDILNMKGRDIVCVPPQTTIQEAITRMVSLKIGAVLVGSYNDIQGIWTERDFMRNNLEKGFDARTARIGDYMNPQVTKVTHNLNTDQLLDLFHRNKLRYLVVEKMGKHVGLIAISDVIQSCLAEKTEDYHRLFHTMKCGAFICESSGNLIDVNPALVSMLGYDNKETFMDRNISACLNFTPEDTLVMEALTLKGERINDHEIDFIANDGSIVPGLITSHAIRDIHGNIKGFEGVVVDVSHRKTMEKELRKALDMLNNVIQSSPNVIIAADVKGTIIIWNKAAEETLGYKNEDVIGKLHIQKIYPEGIARKIMALMRGTEYGGKGRLRSFPMVFVKKDGGTVQVKLSASIIYNELNQEIASVGIFVDFEEQLDMARRLKHTQNLLLQSEKLASMGRLTSLIAHEVNNPLYGIINTLELLKSEVPPENKKRKILDMALGETERLSEMLRKMLSFARPDPEDRQLTDINRLVDEILTLHRKQFIEKNIRIKTRFEKGICLVPASKNQLRQVFLNMITNARDAMAEGGVLTINTTCHDNSVHIIISDTGVGISEENLGRIFDTFFTTKDDVKGVGHGLSLCYGFIKEHGGDISVESEVNKGTIFTIILPLSQEIPG